MLISSQFSAQPMVERAFRYAGSLQMTAFLMVFGVFVVVMGLSTTWFGISLLLIALNLVLAIVRRFPLGRRQTSLVVMHLALVGLLAGAWISSRHAFEGNIALKKGDDSATMELAEQELVLIEERTDQQSGQRHTHVLRQFPLPAKRAAVGAVLLDEQQEGLGLEVVDVLPNAFLQSSLVASPQGLGTGVRFRVSSNEDTVESILLANHPEFRRLDLGFLDIEILSFRNQEDFDLQATASPSNPGITIEFADGSDPLSIPLPAGVGQEFQVGDNLFVTVAAFAEHARVMEGHFVNIPSATPNPAAEVLLRRGKRSERHIIFSQFPDFNTHEQDEKAAMTSKIWLNTPHVTAKPLLTLLCDPAGRLHTQFSNHEGRQVAVQLPQANDTLIAGTSLEFSLLKFVPLAAIETEVQIASGKGPRGADLLKLRLTEGPQRLEFWLEMNKSVSLPVLGPGRSLLFRHQQQPLPFRMGLESMEVSFYPNSRTASGYSSHVLVAETEGMSMARSLQITQNKPVDFMGYRLQQAELATGQEGEPQVSVISVSYNPGTLILYGAFLLLVLGVGWYILNDSPAQRVQREENLTYSSADHIEVVLSPKKPRAKAQKQPQEV